MYQKTQYFLFYDDIINFTSYRNLEVLFKFSHIPYNSLEYRKT